MNKRSKAAVKANATRKARELFRTEYPDTCDVAQDLFEGYDSEEVARYHNLEVRNIAAVLANLNREGRFSTLAWACKF